MKLHFRILNLDWQFVELNRRWPLRNERLSQTDESKIKNPKSNITPLLPVIVVLSALTLSVHAEDTPRSSMRKGLKAYKAGDYTNAVTHLEKTALEFPAIGHFNLGNAQYRAGEYEKAINSYNEALRTTDVDLQAKAYFNRGNAMLARTTDMAGEEQISMAIELAYQATDMFEKAIVLKPEDLEAKQNYERARTLRLNLENNLGKWYFDQAEELLTQYKAKDAQKNYQLAKKQFEHILTNVEPDHPESKQFIPKIEERITMLANAVKSAEEDLATALQYIEDYQYILAAQRLTTETDERKYAFDIKPKLKTKYEQTIQKNSEVLEIIQELFPTTNLAQ